MQPVTILGGKSAGCLLLCIGARADRLLRRRRCDTTRRVLGACPGGSCVERRYLPQEWRLVGDRLSKCACQCHLCRSSPCCAFLGGTLRVQQVAASSNARMACSGCVTRVERLGKQSGLSQGCLGGSDSV